MKNKTVVIKIGGSALSQSETLDQLVDILKKYKEHGFFPLVVHGGGPAINRALIEEGLSWEFIEGQRKTTLEMVDVIDRVLGHELNQKIADYLVQHGVPAEGLSAAEEGLLICSKASEVLGQVGKIERVQLESIQKKFMFLNSIVPVIAPIGVDEKGQKYNINADWAAAQIAQELKADALIYLTDQTGIWDQNKNTMISATPQKLMQLIQQGYIQGGMMTKVLTMVDSLQKGVNKVQVLYSLDASKLFTEKNIGTTLIRDDFMAAEAVA